MYPYLVDEEGAFLDEELEGGDGREDDHVGDHEHGADVRWWLGREGGREGGREEGVESERFISKACIRALTNKRYGAEERRETGCKAMRFLPCIAVGPSVSFP